MTEPMPIENPELIQQVEVRIRRVMASKGTWGADYWERNGRDRFLREAIADGLSFEVASGVITKFEDELGWEGQIHGKDWKMKARRRFIRQSLGMNSDQGVVRTGDGPYSVYVLMGMDGAFLYIGMTSRGLARIEEHYRSKPWAYDVWKMRVFDVETRDEALWRERELIQTLHPVHNVVHNHRATPEPRRSNTA